MLSSLPCSLNSSDVSAWLSLGYMFWLQVCVSITSSSSMQHVKRHMLLVYHMAITLIIW